MPIEGSGMLSFDDDEAEPRGLRVQGVGLLLAFCLVAAVGVSAPTSPSRSPAAAINVLATAASNRDKINNSLVPGVAEKAAQVIHSATDPDNLRWVIFRFNECCDQDPEPETCGADQQCEMAPAAQGAASDDWAADWQSFVKELEGEEGVAAAVYNFEYFTGDSSSFAKPVLITWAPEETSDRDIKQAGYYLGAVMLATKGVHSHYALSEAAETYFRFCADEVGIDAKLCALEREFHNCPFKGDDDLAGNPCDEKTCGGAAFVNPNKPHDEGAIPADCCAYIENWCSQDANSAAGGCHHAKLAMIKDLCDDKAPDEEPEQLMPDDSADEEGGDGRR